MTADGRVAGYRPTATLSIRTETVRQLRRRRTQLAWGFMAALPVILAIAFEIGGDDGTGAGGLIDLATRGAVNFTVFCLLMSVGFLLVVVVALFFGDAIASEASWSSLRYLLTIPIPRSRLLLQKTVVSALLSIGGILVLVVSALAVGAAVYGTGPLVTPFGDSFAVPYALGRVAIGLGYVVVSLAWVAGLALLLSVWTDAPLGAVGGTVMVAILAEILDQITALRDLREFLPGHFGYAWTRAFAPTIDWNDIVLGSFSSIAFASAFGILAWIHFSRKDITS